MLQEECKVQSLDAIPLWPHKAKTEWKNMFFVRETVKRERGNINFFFFLSFLFCHFLFFYYYCQINALFKKKKKPSPRISCSFSVKYYYIHETEILILKTICKVHKKRQCRTHYLINNSFFSVLFALLKISVSFHANSDQCYIRKNRPSVKINKKIQ